MATMRRSGEYSGGDKGKCKVRFRNTYVLDVTGMLVQPSKVFEIEGQCDEDCMYRWNSEWWFDCDFLVVEVLCTNTRWKDTFSIIHMPSRPTLKQIAGVEELLNDFGLSLIGADPYQQTMAYIDAEIFDIDLAIVP